MKSLHKVLSILLREMWIISEGFGDKHYRSYASILNRNLSVSKTSGILESNGTGFFIFSPTLPLSS